jgi:hypothetical protein
MRGNDNEPWARRLARCFPGSHCVISETNCYVSIEAAIEHYEGRCDNPWATVKAKIASGEIEIGEPPSGAPGEFLVLLDGGRRYGIMRELGEHERVDGL